VPAQHKRAEDLTKHGGAEGLAASLRTSMRTGLAHTDTDVRGLARRRAEFGANKFKEVKPRPFLRLLLDNLRDPTLILLMVAAAVRPSWAALLGACSPRLGHAGRGRRRTRACSASWRRAPARAPRGRDPSVRRCLQQPRVWRCLAGTTCSPGSVSSRARGACMQGVCTACLQASARTVASAAPARRCPPSSAHPCRRSARSRRGRRASRSGWPCWL